MEIRHKKNLEDCKCAKCVKDNLLKRVLYTVEGYEVKNLSFKPHDSIITGLVKCPIIGNDEVHGGYVSCVWNTHGHAIKLSKGREDLKINIPNR